MDKKTKTKYIVVREILYETDSKKNLVKFYSKFKEKKPFVFRAKELPEKVNF